MNNKRRLSLIPVREGKDFFERHRVFFCTDRVSFSDEVDPDFLAASIERLRPMPLPEGTGILLRERDSALVNIDLCGNSIRYVYSGAFKSFHPLVGLSVMDWAVIAFFQGMPPDTPILLFWF